MSGIGKLHFFLNCCNFSLMKKTPSLSYIEKTSPARVTTSVRSCLAVRNLIGCDSSLTFQSFLWWSVAVMIPFRYNRRSCCSLNNCRTIISNISHDCLIDIDAHLDCTSPKPSSICTCTSLSATGIERFFFILRYSSAHSIAILPSGNSL